MFRIQHGHAVYFAGVVRLGDWMRRPTVALLGAGLLGFALSAVATLTARGSAPATTASTAPARTPRAARPATVLSVDAQRAVIENYCLTCHDDDHERGGLSLEKFDPARADQNAEVTEKLIRKLRAGMMPPPGKERPEAAVASAFAAALETRVDQAATLKPNPGRRTFQRLNRAEYARSIHDLL